MAAAGKLEQEQLAKLADLGELQGHWSRKLRWAVSVGQILTPPDFYVAFSISHFQCPFPPLVATTSSFKMMIHDDPNLLSCLRHDATPDSSTMVDWCVWVRSKVIFFVYCHHPLALHRIQWRWFDRQPLTYRWSSSRWTTWICSLQSRMAMEISPVRMDR